MNDHENLDELDLESILNEFSDHPIAPPAEEPAEQEPAAPADDNRFQTLSFGKAAEAAEAAIEGNTLRFDAAAVEAAEVATEGNTMLFDATAVEAAEAAIEGDTMRFNASAVEAKDAAIEGDTQRFDASAVEAAVSGDEAQAQPAETDAENAEEAPAEEEKAAPVVIPFSRRTQIQEMKKKLVAGPEKRYYDLTELGVGKVQLAILLNVLIVLLCVAATTLHQMGMVPPTRMKLLIFSQVLALLGSGFLGAQLMMDSIGDLGKGKFSLNMLLTLTFIACCADAVFCLKEQRIPCCAAFSVEMTFALWSKYHRRSTETAQMDTLRKAVKLSSIVKMSDFYEGKSAFLKGEGDVDDFMDTYSAPSGPEKLQNVYAFVSLVLCLGIATVAGLRHDPSVAVQVLANAMLAAAPASFFITLTRPMDILERRLHMVGGLICGWRSISTLCTKGCVPLRDSDLFPQGAVKLNGIKFYSDRPSEEVVSYAASLVIASHSGLENLFRHLLTGRDGTEYPVVNYRDYGSGGVGGEICGEPVLVGTLNFLQDMGVEIPDGTMVSQAVYCAIDGQLSAVIAISYARMRSSSAGLVSIFGSRRLTPVLLTDNFMLTTEFLRSKFGIRTRRLVTPDRETRQALQAKQADPEASVLGLTTRDDLISTAYVITGAKSLRAASRWGVAIHLLGGTLGMLIMLALAYLGSTQLLTPVHVLLYQVIWTIPGLLVTEWTRTV